MPRGRTSLWLMLYIGYFVSAVHSVDCTKRVAGTLTLLSQREGGVEMDVSTYDLPSTTARDAGQTIEGGDFFTLEHVSSLQHAKVITRDGWAAGLFDGAVLVWFHNSTVVPIPLDADYYVPHGLYQHGTNGSAFVMCSNRSRVMKLEQTSVGGFVVNLTPIQGKSSLRVPPVGLFYDDPSFQTSAAFIHFGLTSGGYNKTWLTVVPKLETGANDHLIICDDTYLPGKRESCDTEFASIVGYNATNFVLECRATSDHEAVRFLVDASKEDCNGILDEPHIPSGGTLYVGPDEDMLVVNLGDHVAVRADHFTLSYQCLVDGGTIERVDFATLPDNSPVLVLFAIEGIFTCDGLGKVKLLSSSPLLTSVYPYFLNGKHLFVVQEVSSSSLYQIVLFDVQEGCEVPHPGSSPIYSDKKPVWFAFSPQALEPTTTLPPTMLSSINPTTTKVPSPDAAGNTVPLVVSVMAIILLLLILFVILIVYCCCSRGRFQKSRVARVMFKRVSRDSDSSSSSEVADFPTNDTQQDTTGITLPNHKHPTVAVANPVSENRSILDTVPVQESDRGTNPPIQAEAEKGVLPQNCGQLVLAR